MLSPLLLESIGSLLSNGLAKQAHPEKSLRAAFPGIAFCLCNDNDVPSRIKPLATGPGFALYGIRTSHHCASLSADLESSDGLTIALTDDEN